MKYFPLILGSLLLTACVTTPPPPLTQAAVIAMARAGTTDAEIIRQINQTRTVFSLSADDVVRLRDAGVHEPVVDYMLETYQRAVLAEQRRRDYDRYDYYYDYAYPWPPPGYGPRLRLR
jgi:hypothetical protein